MTKTSYDVGTFPNFLSDLIQISKNNIYVEKLNDKSREQRLRLIYFEC